MRRAACCQQRYFCTSKKPLIFVIEVYKSLMKTNPDFMWDFYTIKHVPYDLRTSKTLYLPTINATLSDLNSLIFRGSLLWNNLPTCIKITQSLPDFKKNLKHFGKNHCTCVVYMCRVHVSRTCVVCMCRVHVSCTCVVYMCRVHV